jgi:hypothetical protein
MVDALIAVIEPIHILATRGTLAQAADTKGAMLIVGAAGFLIPSTVIGLAIGMTEWRETPLAQALGWRTRQGEMNWMDRAADLDGDGHPDI